MYNLKMIFIEMVVIKEKKFIKQLIAREKEILARMKEQENNMTSLKTMTIKLYAPKMIIECI